ncbi:type II secretion system F family protein [Parerythrobacter aurantius]|uniref:type II secretion system F family protein n=1 Tax=Parerythrobacter aurantius TaxID=3127706 RepID=UPI003252DA92
MNSEVVRFLTLLGVFVSVLLIGQLVMRAMWENRAYAGAVNKRLRLIGKGTDREGVVAILRRNHPHYSGSGPAIYQNWLNGFQAKLMMAAVPFTATQFVFGMALLFVVLMAGVSTAIFFSNFSFTSGIVQIVIAFCAALAVGVPILVVSFLAQRRRKRMQEQFPIALDIFVRALRSGHPIASAIDLLTQEMEDPIGSEFGLISDEVSYGAELTDALEDLAERWDLEDIRMFVVSLSVQNETGGNLAEILENLSHVIRERATLYLKVRALSSEGRMTGWLLTGLPIFTFVSLFTMNPAFYLEVAMDPIFYIGFPALIVWYFIGVYVIRRMIDLKV